MNKYDIRMKNDGESFDIKADFYEISEGFVRLFKGEPPREFAAFNSDLVRHITLKLDDGFDVMCDRDGWAYMCSECGEIKCGDGGVKSADNGKHKDNCSKVNKVDL